MSRSATQILDARAIDQKISRIAYQILEETHPEKEVVVMGIDKTGYQLAERLTKELKSISKSKIALGKLQVNKKKPLSDEIIVDFAGQLDRKSVVVLVDDVVNTGKTLMHAANQLLSHDIKRLITTVLIDRTHRQFPIKANYVGLTLATTMQEHIQVELNGKSSCALLS